MYIKQCNMIQNVVSAIEEFMGAGKRDVRAQRQLQLVDLEDGCNFYSRGRRCLWEW